MHADSLLERVLVDFRWVFAIFFVLPLTALGNAWTAVKNVRSRWSNVAANQHAVNVMRVRQQIERRNNHAPDQMMCTARPSWMSMTVADMAYKKYMYNVNVHSDDVILIDGKSRTVTVEPGVTMGRLIPTLIRAGWTLPVALDLEDLTIGGLVMGIGLESSSHKFGLFHETCTRYELVTASGELISCSKTVNADVFESVPHSYGTLGFLTAVDIKLIPAKKYVKLKYRPIRTWEKIEARLVAETAGDGAAQDNDFVELIMYKKDEGVLMTGKMTDGVDDTDKHVNSIGRWYKPWFFKHVETFLTTWKSGEEYVPLKDYYFRHNKSLFWEMQDIIPFGNHAVFRCLLGWLMPAKVSLLKLTQTDTIKRLYENHHFIDDFILPVSALKKSIDRFHDSLNIYPIWVCPVVLRPGRGMVRSRKTADDMHVDVGLYGEPKVPDYGPAIAKELELFVHELKGYKMLYVGTHQSPDQFKTMFDHGLYERVRYRLGCKAEFPEVYDKVNRRVRV